MPDLRKFIKDYPDFPKKGIVFRDISPLLADAEALSAAVDLLADKMKILPAFDKIVAVDARGFIFGAALALKLNKGLVLCRKGAKLPGDVISEDFGYEYSRESLSIKKEAIKTGEKFLVIDDVMATGNTLLAAYKIIEKLGGEVVGILCLVELTYPNGRQLLEKYIEDTEILSVLTLVD